MSGPLGDRGGGGEQHRNERLAPRRDRIVRTVDAIGLRGRDRLEQLHLTTHRHDLVSGGDHDRGGYIDLAEPVERREPAEGGARFQLRGEVEARELLQRPVLVVTTLAQQVLVGQPLAGRIGRGAGETGKARETEEPQGLLSAVVEHAGRRTQHESVDELRVATPQQLGHRATHRIADGDATLDAELARQRGGVVSGVLEREGAAGSHAAPVAAMVGGDHPEPAAERGVGAVEVEIGGHGPAVQQEQCRGAGWTLDLTYERGAAPGQVHRAARGKARLGAWRAAVGPSRPIGAARRVVVGSPRTLHGESLRSGGRRASSRDVSSVSDPSRRYVRS